MFGIDSKNLLTFLIVLLVSVALAFINLYLKLDITPSWYDGTLNTNHALLLDFNYTNNEQSRLLQFYIPELLVRTFDLSVVNAYIVQRMLFTTLTFLLLYYFCKKWFNDALALLCILAFALVMSGTYINDLQESSSLMSLTFLGCLWAIRDRKDLLFMLVLLVGGVNNETMLFLPAVYFFYNYTSKDTIVKLGLKTILLSFPAYVGVGIIRYINIDRPHLGGAWHFTENVEYLDQLFHIYDLFWILPFVFYKKLPLFLQRSIWTIPFFVLPHLITGIISETRQMLPLGLLIIPASLYSILVLRNQLLETYQLVPKDTTHETDS